MPLLRQFCSGEYGIALGGSYVKGIADAHSDVDVYVFAEHALPGPRRAELTRQRLGVESEAVSWDYAADFVEGGTDFWLRGRRVEVWLRNARRVSETIAACCDGRIRRDCVVWTVMGFFNYVLLSDVHTMQVIEDPFGILARWQQATAEYPEPLRRAILQRFLGEARFWPQNLHYSSAVERADVIYTTGIVQQVVQAIIQVVFALNRKYFPGEKKLEQTLGRLAVQPERFVPRVQALLYPGGEVSVERLREQQRELVQLVADVEQCVMRET